MPVVEKVGRSTSEQVSAALLRILQLDGIERRKASKMKRDHVTSLLFAGNVNFKHLLWLTRPHVLSSCMTSLFSTKFFSFKCVYPFFPWAFINVVLCISTTFPTFLSPFA